MLLAIQKQRNREERKEIHTKLAQKFTVELDTSPLEPKYELPKIPQDYRNPFQAKSQISVQSEQVPQNDWLQFNLGNYGGPKAK